MENVECLCMRANFIFHFPFSILHSSLQLPIYSDESSHSDHFSEILVRVILCILIFILVNVIFFIDIILMLVLDDFIIVII